ncbi:hypothetical protein BC937DRAFT_91904 [Endogone sp. FLAS-F59071]|nr:hypothetical protein BC937DRAFT_91904 [Endogone sp. FLAS-F59071]|eukprot:RUS21666.1 hypothetical protein BC937DRAFT_91904 [Endogone sp. FLAS-F59071]
MCGTTKAGAILICPALSDDTGSFRHGTTKIQHESSRLVTTKEGQAMARKLQTLFIECSAKTKFGVKEAFDELVQKIIETPSLWQKQPTPSNVIRVTSESTTDPGSCSC